MNNIFEFSFRQIEYLEDLIFSLTKIIFLNFLIKKFDIFENNVKTLDDFFFDVVEQVTCKIDNQVGLPWKIPHEWDIMHNTLHEQDLTRNTLPSFIN
jgi:hypothetical protein